MNKRRLEYARKLDEERYKDERTVPLSELENIQREDLNPFEQAQGLRDVIALDVYKRQALPWSGPRTPPPAA